jgi:hypothetical protein
MTSDRDWSGEVYATSNGQCYGCPYVAPQAIPVGTVTLHFTSSQTATLTVGGVTISVKRENWWLNETTPDAMQGEWSAVIGAAGDIFDGERIDFPSKYSASGTTYASGYRLGSNGSLNPALVSYDFNSGRWLALLDSSAPYWRLFVFNTTGFNRVEGNFWVYPKGGNPTGSGLFYQAFRTASAAFLQTGTGPASSKSAREGGIEERDESLYRAMQGRGDAKAVDAAIVEAARRLETEVSRFRQLGE